ncbi:LOW QUALITY PROTEIN: NCK-interacting protein with SH3 domain-like [Mercenaria mercenaria]|uniref:LOW QUALITY PROTEIN: NCK-interacting protein with SH3 domain-like n=1 Tax=Mercenaria mercenaria TaxID=6596 RepID=UPI00234F26C1|nr:LOW QUALITY PROTEIN: NCK-interacting protein with SH3 domain-like [Mercenaria mercenaria]
MYRALYDYKTDMKQYLSFVTGDQFTVLDSSQKDWYTAQNGFGEIGYIPKNYVVKDQVSESEILQSIDRAIEIIHYEASTKGGQYTHSQRENLKKLIEHRENVRQAHTNTQESSDWVVVAPESTQASMSSDIQPKRRSVRRTAPAPPVRSSAEITTRKVQQPATAPVQQNLPDQHISSEINADEEVIVIDMSNCRSEKLAVSIAESLWQKQTVLYQRQILPQKQTVFQQQTVLQALCPLLQNYTSVTENKLIDCRTIPLPSELGNELVEEIRRNTGLSYKKSCIAVETVLGHMGLKVPEISELMDRIHGTMYENDADKHEEETSLDYERLCELFAELTECKDDSQQRGWHLHEDEDIINSNLEEMSSILENAKQSVAKKALARDNYEGVYSLVQYYQMENRLRLKLVLLRVFGAMCSLDSAVISLLLFSVLTTELAEELQQNIEDLQRSSHVTLLLCMIFSTGEPVPANLHDYLNAEFIHFVFKSLDNPPSIEHEEEVVDLLVNFILAFNLHCQMPSDNLVMKVIEERKTVKVFTEKLLLLFNRDEDPVQMFEHEPKPPNSVMKILQDMYSSPGTANILYTNDARVLIDIILRHLIDLPPGDKLRSEHLKLMQLYLQNADYVEHKHRYAELSECLHRIHTEEEDTGDDKHIVTYIFTQLNLFND